MALSANVNYEATSAPGQDETQAFLLTNATVVFAGSYVGIISGTGLVSTISDTAGMSPLGFSMDEATGATATGLTIPVNVGGITLKEISVTGVTGQGDVGESVFVTDDNTFTLTPTTNLPRVGYVVRFHTGTTVDVRFRSHAEMQADITGL